MWTGCIRSLSDGLRVRGEGRLTINVVVRARLAWTDSMRMYKTVLRFYKLFTDLRAIFIGGKNLDHVVLLHQQSNPQ